VTLFTNLIQRRDALRRLIDLTHSPHSNLKIFAAANIKNYFNDFPDLEDSAINAIYDLCEDQDSMVSSVLSEFVLVFDMFLLGPYCRI
jgi:hypothetical protein